MHRQNKIAFICCLFKNTRDSCEQTRSLDCIRDCMKMSTFYLKWCIISWNADMSDRRLTNILELQSKTLAFSFSRWSLMDHMSERTKHYWFTVMKFPWCILQLRYICSKLLDTRWGVCHCVISQTGGAIWPPLLGITGKQKFKTSHTPSCSVTAVPSCGSRPDWHTREGRL